MRNEKVIEARIEQRSHWALAQEAAVEAAWGRLGRDHQRYFERFLLPGERAPEDIPMAAVDRMMALDVLMSMPQGDRIPFVQKFWNMVPPHLQAKAVEKAGAFDEWSIYLIAALLAHFGVGSLEPEPEPSDEFYKMIDSMRTPRDPASLRLGSDTYMPGAAKILQEGGRLRNVRITV